MSTIPLEEAPFWRYLEVLRENGYEEDAELSEAFYVELLTTIKHAGGENYTREQVMNAKFKNLVHASELILEHAQREVQSEPLLNVPIGGKVLVGMGAGELSDETLYELAVRQAMYHEQNKLQQGIR